MKEQIAKIRLDAEKEIHNSKNLKELDDVRIKYLGKKGELTSILRMMGGLSTEERPVMGSLVNETRDNLEKLIQNSEYEFKEEELKSKMLKEKIDVTMPGKNIKVGSFHPISKTIRDIEDIFIGLGYEVASGPEVEFTVNNFDKLNMHADHPARDLRDTFYITPKILLRAETSTVQIRTMENKKPPIKIICPGKVYRQDAVDATHSPVFHQCEGLVVDKGITMADLKGTLQAFAKAFLGEDTKIRFRPHHFPFTEPSAEVDVSCFICGGKGCKVCKNEGWIEILGCGMVHPNVLKNCGIDSEIYTGFAFGFGVDRIAMAKYEIDDLRLLFENDVRFLTQFGGV